jgi:NCAIR mutase (PurE)-related protein
MSTDELRQLLEAVRGGRTDVTAALGQLGGSSVADLGFAQVDLDRRARCGFPEVIFCEGKTPEWVEGVARRLADARPDCLGTRVNAEQAAHLAKAFPQAEQDRLARTFWLPIPGERPQPKGHVLVVTAGTGDLPVAQEAAVTARSIGAEVDLVADVVAAGMDGALPSVVGGLADCPVIAVPTSIGYGAALGGIAPLLTMLNACSANVTVVNIDAGFKAGYVAALIARRAAVRS